MPLSLRLLRWGIALLLLPLTAAAGWSLVELFQALWNSGEWKLAWCWSVGGGLAAWLLLYAALPRPLWIYVFGHELTHALAVYLHAGRVHRFQVSSRGGMVVSDRSNWIIALAPYFIPVYTLLLIGLWWTADFYHPLAAYTPWFYAGIGLTWGFHLTFTVSMIGAGQSDLTGQGVFFSLVVIVLLNLLAVEISLLSVLHGVSWGHFFRQLGGHAWDAYAATGRTLWHGARWTASFLSGLLADPHAKPAR
ncbi:MAG: hypothetical protein PW734_04630 [Verrucomicrobium sp.]|nr:hypothetical protein [Verrucomicrobium sp.]